MKVSPTHKTSRPLAVWVWVKANGHTPLTGLGALAVGMGSLHSWWFVSGAALSMAGLVWGLFAAPKVHEILEREGRATTRALERTDVLKSVLQRILHQIAQTLALDLSQSRISVYTHVEDTFFMVMRHSSNPVLSAPGRTAYPDRQGLIGAVWSTGDCRLVQNLPKDRDLWNEKCTSKWQIPRATVSEISMQARSLIGRRIDSAEGHRSQALGVIILESLLPAGLTGEHRDQLEQYSGVLLEVLAMIVDALDDQDGLSAAPGAIARRTALPTPSEL